MLDRKYNYKRPLVFAHVALTSNLSARKARDTKARIDRHLDLWERGIHTGLLGDALSEGKAREGRIEQRKLV